VYLGPEKLGSDSLTVGHAIRRTHSPIRDIETVSADIEVRPAVENYRSCGRWPWRHTGLLERGLVRAVDHRFVVPLSSPIDTTQEHKILLYTISQIGTMRPFGMGCRSSGRGCCAKISRQARRFSVVADGTGVCADAAPGADGNIIMCAFTNSGFTRLWGKRDGAFWFCVSGI